MNDNKRTLKEEIALVIAGYKVLLKIEKRFIRIPIAKSIFNAFLPFVNLFTSAKILSYYNGSIYNLTGAMDIKIYRQAPTILEEMRVFGENAPYLKLKEKIMYKYKNIQIVLNAAVNIIVYSYIAVKAFIGTFGIGQVLQYTGAVSRFISGVSGIAYTIADYPHNNIYLKNILDYINMPNNMYKGTLSIEKRDDNEYEIEFRNVSFKYPSSELYVLKNISFKFNIGQRLAVVGMNGSGKTTMIKLLCRLYDPTAGEILLNGIDIKKYKYKEYLDLFSVVFQDFNLFAFTLGQNVAADVKYEYKRAEQCLNMAGFAERLNTLPKELETSLYKSFDDDGVEISGGEAQKIALARALYKNAPFIVLDEPTAALDPIAEFEIYSKFNEIVENKTAIYISHRLSSCRFCDDIAVFHEGELVQRGSHNELIMDTEGKYYELWNAQAQYYTENKII